jgi:hypothetical protein
LLIKAINNIKECVMKNSKKTLFILSVLFIIGTILSSCASAGPTQGYATTIEEAHPDRFEKTVIGMDVNEFKTVWPEARRSGISNEGETYEFIYTHFVGGIYGSSYDYKIYAYFYFTSNKLVKYESNKKSGL